MVPTHKGTTISSHRHATLILLSQGYCRGISITTTFLHVNINPGCIQLYYEMLLTAGRAIRNTNRAVPADKANQAMPKREPQKSDGCRISRAPNRKVGVP